MATTKDVAELDRGLPAGFRAQALERLAKQGRSVECIAFMGQALEAPSRNTASGPRHMSGKFASSKMGISIGFESRTLEYAAVRKLENDERVWAYVEQPPKLKLTYKDQGQTRAYLVTPDFVVAYEDRVVIVECKRLEVVQKKSMDHPELYVLRDGRWTCPPAEADARRMGMEHELWTESDFTYCSVANALFLDGYLAESVEVPGYEPALDAIQKLLAVRARSTILELLATLRLQGVQADHVHMAIARGDVAVNLEDVPVSVPESCLVFRDQPTMAAFAACEQSRDRHGVRVPMVHLQGGAQLLWDGTPWTVLNAGAHQVSLYSNGRNLSLPVSVFQGLVKDGLIESVSGSSTEDRDLAASNRLLAATTAELRIANKRLERIEPYLNGVAKGAPVCRSTRRHLASYREAQRSLGHGFVGLIPATSNSGNRRGRLRQDVLERVRAAIDEHYLTPTRISAKDLYGRLVVSLESSGLPAPSYQWLVKLLNRLPPDLVARARSGDKVAYVVEPRVEPTELADASEPVRPFERAHVDHTPLDLETVNDAEWMGLGRVWVTVMIDHYSRRILGLHLTYAAPSYASVMSVMRDCVRRFGRLPEALVVDGGKEFRSTWFETTCAWYRVTIFRRPAAKARYGAQIERFFGTLNTTLIHRLLGNTQNTRNVRQMTAAVSPSRHAVWSFLVLFETVERYVFEVYDSELSHRELAMTPNARFVMGMATTGQRPWRAIAYDLTFRILTCPSTAKQTAKVTRDGVKINYLYYNSPKLQGHYGKPVNVRFDNDDMSIAYAHVDGAWIRLRARHQGHFRFFTAHYIALLTDEWRRRRSSVEKERLTDRALIAFHLEVQKTETLLKERQQELRERALRERLLSGGDAHQEDDASDETQQVEHLDMAQVEQGEQGTSNGSGEAQAIEIRSMEVC